MIPLTFHMTEEQAEELIAEIDAAIENGDDRYTMEANFGIEAARQIRDSTHHHLRTYGDDDD